MIQRKKGIEKQVKEEFAKARKEVEIRHCHNLYNRMADSHPTHNWHYMKLRDKDTKKYLLSVAVSTFVSYVVTFISFYGRVYYDIIETTCVCICLLNVVTALLAWKFAKSNSKMSLLVLHWELDTLAMLPLMGFSIWAITDGTIACFFAIIQFILLGIFNLFIVGLSLAVYSFIQHKCKIRSKDINQFCL